MIGAGGMAEMDFAAQIASEYGAVGVLVVAVVALWRRLELLSTKLTENYQAVRPTP